MEHKITLENRRVGTISRCRATCSCGEWMSGWMLSEDVASIEAFNHVSKYWD